MNKRNNKILFRRFPRRGWVVFAHDIVMAGLSFLITLYLRLGEQAIQYGNEILVQGTIAFMAVAAVVFWFMGLYRGVWRYASMNDLVAISRAATAVILVFLGVMFIWTRLEAIPRSIPFINWFVLMALIGGPRFLYRISKDRRIDLHLERASHRRIPVLLAGAGDGAEMFIRSLPRSGDETYQVVGIVSQSANRVGRQIHGVEVFGTYDDLIRIVGDLKGKGQAYHPQRLILTNDNLDRAVVRRLLKESEQLGMTLGRLPRLTEFKSGIDDKVEVRPVALEDLLGRAQTVLDRHAMRRLIEGRRVLITGAGGSIGSELARQVAAFAPSMLILIENSEYNLYAIDLEIARTYPGLHRKAIMADTRDRKRIERVFDHEQPELVFHAAALKHVPMVEANPFEGVLTNVIGTANVAESCVRAGVATMVMISTDKAVNPTSVMGATKRIAEQYCQALDLALGENGATRFISVRFGNVLGSTGSVVPLFQQQIASGGPLTVTHPEMTRYFMTVHESVELVLQASAIGSRDAHHEGRIFVLDMGEPVRIVDIARQLIRLAGLRPDDDIKINFVGLRPGEKLFEEKFHGGESLLPTEAEGILLARPRTADVQSMRKAARNIEATCTAEDLDALLAIIRDLVPEYAPEHREGETPAS